MDTREDVNKSDLQMVRRGHTPWLEVTTRRGSVWPMKAAHLWQQTAAFVPDPDDLGGLRSALQPLLWPAHRRHPTPPERFDNTGRWLATVRELEEQLSRSPSPPSSPAHHSHRSTNPQSSRSSPEQDGHHEQVRLEKARDGLMKMMEQQRGTSTRSCCLFKVASCRSNCNMSNAEIDFAIPTSNAKACVCSRLLLVPLRNYNKEVIRFLWVV